MRVLQDFAPPAGGRGKLAPWWFADALVVVASAGDDDEQPADGFGVAGDGSVTSEVDAAAAAAADEKEEAEDAGGGKKHVSHQEKNKNTAGEGVSRSVQHPPLQRTPAQSGAKDVDATAESPMPAAWLLTLARVAGQMGPSAIFVLCEECDGDDGGGEVEGSRDVYFRVFFFCFQSRFASGRPLRHFHFVSRFRARDDSRLVRVLRALDATSRVDLTHGHESRHGVSHAYTYTCETRDVARL